MEAYKTIQCKVARLESTINDLVKKKWYLHTISSLGKDELIVVFTSSSNSERFETEFQNFNQKANQLFNILSTVMKSIKEMKSSIERNIR